MSPEALMGGDPDPTFDLWSLAMVVYEALAGRNPVACGNSLALGIWDEALPNLQEFRPDCPKPLADFLADALARERRRRPATAREFLLRLAAARPAQVVSPGSAAGERA
jgi:serine/threonine-protein kinase